MRPRMRLSVHSWITLPSSICCNWYFGGKYFVNGKGWRRGRSKGGRRRRDDFRLSHFYKNLVVLKRHDTTFETVYKESGKQQFT